MSHHRTVLALWRDESGQLCAWRVGRRRLAWRPRFPRPPLEGADGGPFEIVVIAILAVLGLGHLLNWLAALLATSVVWPCRAISGRWPVVAYPLDPSLVATDDPDGDPPHRRRVAGRTAAVALTRQWVRDIERHGHPDRLVDRPGPVASTDQGSR